MSRESSEIHSPTASVHSANGLSTPLLQPLDILSSEDADVKRSGHFLTECYGLSRLAGPLVLQNLAGYMLSIIPTAFLGHLNDPVALSAAILGGSLYNITGYSLVMGLSAGMETLCGQAYGAGNYLMVGLVLQRALLICWAACVPIALLWSQAGNLLRTLNQQPDIVAGASRYLSIATPALILSVVSSCLYRYLVTQQLVRPPVICTLVTAALCPLYNWLLVYRLHLGLEGAAWAFVASTATYSALLAVYTAVRESVRYRRGSHTLTWPGLSWRMLQGWGAYLRFAAPAAAMSCMEWWIFELMIFMAGLLGSFAEVAVAVMGISFNITSWAYMIPMALGTATNTLVANALGAGSATSAHSAARTSIAVALALQLALGTGLFVGRHHVALAFTTQPDIVRHVGRIMPVLAASAVGDGMIAVLGGVLRGAGRQSLGAALNLVGYWVVGCPLALLLGFRAGWNIFGFWCGLAVATSLQTVILASVVSLFDWEREVVRAAKLVSEHAGGTEHGTATSTAQEQLA